MFQLSRRCCGSEGIFRDINRIGIKLTKQMNCIFSAALVLDHKIVGSSISLAVFDLTVCIQHAQQLVKVRLGVSVANMHSEPSADLVKYLNPHRYRFPHP